MKAGEFRQYLLKTFYTTVVMIFLSIANSILISYGGPDLEFLVGYITATVYLTAEKWLPGGDNNAR